MNKRSLASKSFLLLILVLFAIIFLPISKSFDKDIFVSIQYLVIGLISVLQIVRESGKRFFSLNLIHWFFIYAFMFSAGISQFANNSFRWDFIPTIDEVKIANNIIILWCILYSILFFIFDNRKNRRETKKIQIFYPEYNIWINIVLIILVVLSCFTIYLVDFKSFFVRSLYEDSSLNKLFNQSSLSLLVLSLIRGLSLWTTMIFASRVKYCKNLRNVSYFIISILCSLLLVPPLGVARYVFACFYGGLFLLYFDFFKKKNVFIYILFVGLLVLFPMLNAFRGLYTTDVANSFIKESIGNIEDNFSTSDYDSYTMLIYTVRYCAKEGITNGRQLLGTILFFIPRSIWKNKPGGSGALIIEKMATTYVDPNVSCPFIAEGYMNFGIFGVICFCVLFVCMVRTIDYYYWKVWKDKSSYGQMFYSFAIFYFVFLLRGDLMSSFSTLCGYVFTFIMLRLLTKKPQNI